MHTSQLRHRSDRSTSEIRHESTEASVMQEEASLPEGQNDEGPVGQTAEGPSLRLEKTSAIRVETPSPSTPDKRPSSASPALQRKKHRLARIAERESARVPVVSNVATSVSRGPGQHLGADKNQDHIQNLVTQLATANAAFAAANETAALLLDNYVSKISYDELHRTNVSLRQAASENALKLADIVDQLLHHQQLLRSSDEQLEAALRAQRQAEDDGMKARQEQRQAEDAAKELSRKCRDLEISNRQLERKVVFFRKEVAADLIATLDE